MAQTRYPDGTGKAVCLLLLLLLLLSCLDVGLLRGYRLDRLGKWVSTKTVRDMACQPPPPPEPVRGNAAPGSGPEPAASAREEELLMPAAAAEFAERLAARIEAWATGGLGLRRCLFGATATGSR